VTTAQDVPPPPPGFKSGLEGHVAFRTQIAEPDKDGGALRYRGVDIEDLVGHVTFGNVWALLVDGRFGPGLPPADPFPIPVHTGDVRVDVQAALAMLAPYWGYRAVLDITDEEARDQLARASVMALSYVAQSARGIGVPAVPQSRIDQATTITERFMVRWRGEPDPAHVKAIDAYWVSAAEHGMNASTFTARVITSTGADVAAAMSGAIGASMASAAWTSTRTSPVCTGSGKGSAGGRPWPKRPSTRRPHTSPKVTLPARSSMSTPR
jgi:citrate synthase